MHHVTFTNFAGQFAWRTFDKFADAIQLINTLKAIGLDPYHFFEE